MNRGKHMYLLVGLVAVGAVLFLSGVGGGAVFLLWLLACMAMMAVMVTMMWGMGRRENTTPPAHTHADGRTHSHN